MALTITIILVILGFISGEEELGIAIALVAGLFLIRKDSLNRTENLQQQVDELKAKLKEDDFSLDLPESETQVESTKTAASNWNPEPSLETKQAAATKEKPGKRHFKAHVAADPSLFNQKIDAFTTKTQQMVMSYFTDGNLFVRVGLLILFFGVAFLLKYAAENSKIPLEFRFLGAAAGGLFLLVLGWRLRAKKEIYALLLQGGGIGIIYITIFASYRLADLIPSTLTFILLVLFAVFSAALAILQNSRSLMIFAVLGGFLAPFLASSGSGNYIGLFSYYALLNVSIFIVAWFKSWRLLNLLGFIFTFGIYTLWFVASYKTEYLYPALGFLTLFFMMYSVLGVLYAIKQKQNLKGLVDGTLVFGTPVIASSLAMAMIRHVDYGIAICAALLGIYYVLLARWLWQRQGEQMRLMAEALLAIGVIFATLAIPYSLDGHWTSATWALEAAGILWVSIRQQRVYAQYFALLVQLGAGVLFLMRNADDLGNTAWINPSFLGGAFIALGAFISARLLYQLDASNKLKRLHGLFYLWAMGWWLGSAVLQIDKYIAYQTSAVLALLLITALALSYLDRIRGWNWMPASISIALFLPLLVFISLFSILEDDHLMVYPNAFLWLLALPSTYWMLFKLESVAWAEKFKISLHTLFVIFLCGFLSYELTWYFYDILPATGQGFTAVSMIFPLLFLYWSRVKKFPAIARFGFPLQLSISSSMALLILGWALIINLTNTADPAPLPYVPFINPVDLAHLIFFISIIRFLPLLDSQNTQIKQAVYVATGGLMFIWLSAVLLRSMHHYLDIDFDLSVMLLDVQVQTALSILWTVIGMLTMLFSARKQIRQLWIAAAVLVVLVLIKMFFIDLGASGTVERIVSFLVVGGLLVAMGYFSPIPQKTAAQTELQQEADNG